MICNARVQCVLDHAQTLVERKSSSSRVPSQRTKLVISGV